jgi:hypothetical protein
VLWTSKVDARGRVDLPDCTDIIAMKQLIDLYDERSSFARYLQTHPDEDKDKMMVDGLKSVRTLASDKVETATVRDGNRDFSVPLRCEAAIQSNHDSGIYHFGYFAVAKDGHPTKIMFAAKPEYGSRVASVTTGVSDD